MGIPRKVKQIAAAQDGSGYVGEPILYALADDDTLWAHRPRRVGADEAWTRVPDLPEAEACDGKSGGTTCLFAMGHRDYHWDGVRRWL